jgi:DNA (cytosine-5)-methyltransferase 1
MTGLTAVNLDFETARPNCTADSTIMSTKTIRVSESMLLSEIVVDSFAGGGGASTGIEMALEALGYDKAVDIAINHNGPALAMHAANHPGTLHMESDIWTVDPLSATKGQPVGLMWASPDCRHFSRAKGSTPVSKKIRGLAWSIAHWAEQVQPRLIFLENVEEFQTWGPLILGPKGHEIPDPERVGTTFREWIGRFKRAGYRVEWRVLRACDFGAPTIRKRLYIIMRRDGEKIVWPSPSHGDPKSPGVRSGKRLPWVTAAEIIDWDLPCPSILMTKDDANAYTKVTGRRIIRPLADNTMARIAAGVRRYVLEAADPFIVTCNHSGSGFRGQGLSEPFVTVAGARDAHGLVIPTMTPFITSYYGESGGRNDRAAPVDEPLRTITTEPRFGVVETMCAPYMTAHYGSDIGSAVDAPMRTITGIPKIEPVVSTLAQPPLSPEQYASAQRVAEFLRQYGEWHGDGLVIVGDRVIVDIGMRMLTPRELARAQGFPDDYVLAAPFEGGSLSESDQRHKIGNSVCPPVAAALVGANYRPQRRAVVPANQGWLFDEAAA